MPLRGHWKKHSFPNVQNHLTSKIRTCFIQSPYRDLLLICWVFPENSKSLKIPNGRFAEGKLRSSTWPSYWICGRPPCIQRTIPIGCAERAKLCGLLQGIARQPLKRGRYGEDEKRCSNFWAPDVRSILIFYIYLGRIYGRTAWCSGMAARSKWLALPVPRGTLSNTDGFSTSNPVIKPCSQFKVIIFDSDLSRSTFNSITVN